jgi:phosphoribosylformimino-5-aminoimidazole carboxamide ribotide isomerase
MLILPAIDLRGGLCVRLAQGDFDRETVYGSDAGEVARGFAAAGATWIHVVDLDGARTGEPQNWGLLESILASGLHVELGGGIRNVDRARAALELGVERVVVGSRLVQDPELSARFFGELGERVVAGIDARDGMVATDGWEAGSGISAEALARQVWDQGCRRVILTDIARDGMQTGPNLEFLQSVARVAPLRLIQSGGVGSIDDLEALAHSGVEGLEGVIVGRAIYEGAVDLAASVARFQFSAC